jgi:hypothetical protein
MSKQCVWCVEGKGMERGMTNDKQRRTTNGGKSHTRVSVTPCVLTFVDPAADNVGNSSCRMLKFCRSFFAPPSNAALRESTMNRR